MPVNKGTIFRIFLALALVIPALICQTVAPLIGQEQWESINEFVYRFVLSFESPLPTPRKGYPPSDGRKHARVVIIQAGSKSRKVLGDPVPRRNMIKLLGLLKENGNPWVLSRLSFESMAPPPPPPKKRMRRSEKRRYQEKVVFDQLWADTLKYYKKFISASVYRAPGQVSELKDAELEILNPGLMLSNQPVNPSLSDMPFHSVRLREPLNYMGAAGALGLMSFDEGTGDCLPVYFSEEDEVFVLPHAILWAYAFGSESGFSTWKEAKWPRRVGHQPFTFRRNSKIAPLHCLGSPSTELSEFMRVRKIDVLELSDVLAMEAESNDKHKKRKLKNHLKGRVVILSSDRQTDLYDFSSENTGPPLADRKLARFLDDMITQSSIRRYPHHSWEIMSWLPIILAGIILVPGIFVTMNQTLILMVFMLILLTGFTFIQLHMRQVFLIPSQGLLFMAGSLLEYFMILAGLRLYGQRRVEQFRNNLRSQLSQALELEELKMATQSVCGSYFSVFKIFFLGTDDQLHEAAASFEGARDYISKVVKEHSNLEKGLQYSGGEFDQRRTMYQTVLTTMKRVPSRNLKALGERNLNARLAISGPDNVRLGTLDLQLSYYSYEDGLIVQIVDVLQSEVALNWSRLELQARKKLREYHDISQGVTGDILSRFLSPTLMRKFNPDVSIDNNLRKILLPKPVQIVMLQADIRGFTTLSGEYTVENVVERLQKYYRNVVESARKIAQVRLLGDSIFIFIEENVSPRQGISSTDLALQLAGSLVRETEKQNDSDQESMPVNFGIAIHTGEVIAGNLTSGSLVDYTIIGQNVNLVGKIEQLTRIPKVHKKIGANGILLTPEAKKSLNYFSGLEFNDLNLEDVQLTVRSFPLVKKLHFVSKANAIALANKVTITRMVNPSLPLE